MYTSLSLLPRTEKKMGRTGCMKQGTGNPSARPLVIVIGRGGLGLHVLAALLRDRGMGLLISLPSAAEAQALFHAGSGSVGHCSEGPASASDLPHGAAATVLWKCGRREARHCEEFSLSVDRTKKFHVLGDWGPSTAEIAFPIRPLWRRTVLWGS